jgi:ABC-type nickel/cobalt efflux system permease component RcnA
MLGRNSPTFTAVRAHHFGWGNDDRAELACGEHALTGGIGLLPCPQTILVLGFAWKSLGMVLVVLISLALGVPLTMGLVALAAIAGRRTMGVAVAGNLPGIERWSRMVQTGAGILIVIIGIVALMLLGG